MKDRLGRSGRPWRQLSSVLILVCLVPSLAAASEAKPTDLDRLKQASDSAYVTVITALAEEDAEMLASVFSQEATVISPTGQSLSGRSAIYASAALLMMTVGGGELELSRIDLKLTDSSASETGVYRFSQPLDDSQHRVWTGRFVVVWILENKIWKISRATGLPSRPGG